MSAQPEFEPPTTVPLAEAGACGRDVVGGKAFSLSQLLNRGFNVPDGFVVTTAAHTRWIESNEVPVLEDELGDGAYAFRSSAVGEDSAEASFAGQFVSVLGVRAGEAGEALERCWSSAHTGALDQYAHATGRSGGAIAVLVQRMVDADVAGVSFTANPVTGADEVVIEAVRGLADQLLEGVEEPERWTVRARAERTSADRGVLTADLAAQVATCSRQIAAMFGSPQDIEWAVADGELFILQSRPITALPVEPKERPPAHQTWERQDTHFHGPVHPLLASAWLPAHARCFERVAARSGMPFDTVRSRVFGGRVYARAEPLGDGGVGRDDRSPPPAWLMGLLMRVVPSFRRRIKAAARAVAEDLPIKLIEDWESSGREQCRARITELLDVDRRALDDGSLADHIDEVLAHAEQCGDVHFMLLVVSGGSTTGALGCFLQRHTDLDVPAVLDLLQGYGEASVASGAALDALAATIEADDEAVRFLHDDPDALRTDTGEAGAAYREFLDRRGHRIYGYAMDQPMWAEDPTPLVRLLQSRLRGAATQTNPRDVSRAAEQRLRDRLEPGGLWPQVARLLERARRARPYQDETEDLCFEMFGILRYAAVEAGQRLEQRGVIASKDDVWFLEVEELLEALRGGACDVDVARRRGEYRWGFGNDLGRVLGPKPQPPPQMSFPREVDELLGGIFWYLLADAHTTPPHPDADLVGVGCSPGEVSGRVKVIRAVEDVHLLEPGDILVCPCTTAAWSVAFPLVAGLITEVGGPLSHPATLAREYGIPAVLGVANATQLLHDGDMVRIDGAAGAVWYERS